MAIAAEFKRASPSKGDIAVDVQVRNKRGTRGKEKSAKNEAVEGERKGMNYSYSSVTRGVLFAGPVTIRLMSSLLRVLFLISGVCDVNTNVALEHTYTWWTHVYKTRNMTTFVTAEATFRKVTCSASPSSVDDVVSLHLIAFKTTGRRARVLVCFRWRSRALGADGAKVVQGVPRGHERGQGRHQQDQEEQGQAKVR